MAKPKKKQRRKPGAPTQRVADQPNAVAPPVDAKAAPSKWGEWTRSILIAIGIALLIRWPIVEPFRIPSGSMEPTLQDGDRIFVDKSSYGVRYPFNGFRIPFTRTTIWYAHNRLLPLGEPQRWDIVVFKAAEEGVEKHTLVKRVVGMPGERVHIENGRVYVNGDALELPPDMPEIHYSSPTGVLQSNMRYGILEDDQHAIVPDGHYFVMGDNSDFSRDGRYFGWLPERNLLGRVTSIWWPLGRLRDFTGFTTTWWWRALLVALGALTLTRMFVGQSWHVRTQLLSGALRKGDHVFVNRIKYGLPLPFTRHRIAAARSPKPGEIVVYHHPNRQPGQPELLVGRVAGVGGDDVRIQDGRLIINGTAPDTKSGLDQIDLSPQGTAGPYAHSKSREYSHVPDGHLFILLDESDGSEDSRSLGWIPAKSVIGQAAGVWWPVYRARRVTDR